MPGNSVLRITLVVFLLLGAVMLSACVSEPEVCNYNKVCEQNETDNCADCRDVLGRDVKSPTGQVIYVDNYNDNQV
jgi:starvation-inducible outer membrane lipoprotein